MSSLFGKNGTVSYTIKSNIITGTENNVVSLTKSLNLYQKVKLLNAENVRIKHLKVVYKPRTGPLGQGTIDAWVRDNRIDGDLSDPIINRCRFSATEHAVLTWESCVWLAKSDLTNSDHPPIVFEMELSECNMTAGHSIGMVSIVVEISASETMTKFLFKQPTLTLGEDQLAIKSQGYGNGFLTKRKDVKRIGESSIPRLQEITRTSNEAPEKTRLRSVASESLRSRSMRLPIKRTIMYNDM
ncbi:TPA_asm: P3 [Artemisia alphacytorhabdovirus 2]|nr:TPA_asm: P3 [Artemisia alphacytorhabdovirus 2]